MADVHHDSSSDAADKVKPTATTTAHPVTATGSSTHGDAAPSGSANNDNDAATRGLHLLESRPARWWSRLATPDFWLVVAIGQVLALCITATNTFTSFLADAHASVPAFQTLFNYVLLFLVYTAVLLVRDGGLRAWRRAAAADGWKYLVMAFLDVEGNYFTVLAYRYTNILSAQLINFWSIVCVVALSFFLLRVRYRAFQVLGILVCCGGMGILLASDYMTRSNVGPAANVLKGDLFALLGATLYGTSNVLEEWLVSRRPAHHVLAFIGLFGMLINGVQAAIFDRADLAAAAGWENPHRIAAWLVGYTLCLFLFYTLAPLILRMGSAAFFDISLLTANFWGAIIGTRVFGLPIHYLYPVAFVCIVVGLVTYSLTGRPLGDAKKPWLGENQEHGVAGLGTAKLRAINAAQMARHREPEDGQRCAQPTDDATAAAGLAARFKLNWQRLWKKDAVV